MKLGPEDIFGEALFTLIGDVNGLNREATKDRAPIIVRVAVEVMRGVAKVTTNCEVLGRRFLAEGAEGLCVRSRGFVCEVVRRVLGAIACRHGSRLDEALAAEFKEAQVLKQLKEGNALCKSKQSSRVPETIEVYPVRAFSFS